MKNAIRELQSHDLPLVMEPELAVGKKLGMPRPTVGALGPESLAETHTQRRRSSLAHGKKTRLSPLPCAVVISCSS